MRKLIYLCMLGLVVTGCGSDGDGGSAMGGSGEYKAQFIDSPVENLAFVNESGETAFSDSNGSFACTEGELLQVKMGNLELGRVACGEKVYPHAITDDTEFEELVSTSPDVYEPTKGTYLSAVLIRLDEDNDPDNGIKIPDSAHDVTDFDDPKFSDEDFDPSTEFNEMNAIISKVYTDNSRDWNDLNDLDGYIASDVIPHLEQSAQDHIDNVRSSILNGNFTDSYTNDTSITNDTGSPCSYDDVQADIGCSVNTCWLDLTLKEGGVEDEFRYLFTQFGTVYFANTFANDYNDYDPDPALNDYSPYRVMIELTLTSNDGPKLTGKFQDDHTVSPEDVCSGTFELVKD